MKSLSITLITLCLSVDVTFTPRDDDRIRTQILDETARNDPNKERNLEELRNKLKYTPEKWNFYNAAKELQIDVYVQDSIKSLGMSSINEAIKELKGKTCVNFNIIDDKTSKAADSFTVLTKQYLEFTKEGRGCDEIVGMKNPSKIKEYPQIQPFSAACLGKKQNVMHTLMHILGFDNEVQREDRVTSGKVIESDIMAPSFGAEIGNEAASRDAFTSITLDNVSFKNGTKYDKHSIMHWGLDHILIDRESLADKKLRREKGHMRLGHDAALSEEDVLRVNKYYCPKNREATKAGEPGSGQPGLEQSGLGQPGLKKPIDDLDTVGGDDDGPGGDGDRIAQLEDDILKVAFTFGKSDSSFLYVNWLITLITI